MRLLLALALACAGSSFAQEKLPLPVTRLQNEEMVPARLLPGAAQIAVKPLPGRPELAACQEARCVLIRRSLKHEGQWMIHLAELCSALDLNPAWNEARTHVTLHKRADPAAAEIPPAPAVFTVGQLAPDFQLPKLNGGRISLSDLRGRRVLINSWASW